VVVLEKAEEHQVIRYYRVLSFPKILAVVACASGGGAGVALGWQHEQPLAYVFSAIVGIGGLALAHYWRRPLPLRGADPDDVPPFV
jgi:hypothetical protein